MYVLLCFFKQKTAYEMRISDWSSDVCSSDLVAFVVFAAHETDVSLAHRRTHIFGTIDSGRIRRQLRSELLPTVYGAVAEDLGIGEGPFLQDPPAVAFVPFPFRGPVRIGDDPHGFEPLACFQGWPHDDLGRGRTLWRGRRRLEVAELGKCTRPQFRIGGCNDRGTNEPPITKTQ